MTQETETEAEPEVEKEELMGKPFSEWSSEELEQAQEMTHSLSISVFTVSRLQEYGQKGMSWDEIVQRVLDEADEGGDEDE